MSKKNVLILIPARFASSRFPGKPLALIKEKSMIKWVVENCNQCRHETYNFQTFVVTDDERIESHVRNFTPNVLRVDDDVVSGSLRILLAYQRFFSDEPVDLIINVQGDEPLLQSKDLVDLADFHLKSTFDIATLVKKQTNFHEDFHNPNKVKVVLSEKTRQAFYFSRSGIPFKRDDSTTESQDFWYLHIGVYSYRPRALASFGEVTESRLESLEKLEQLRALECGLSIGAMTTECTIVGVDQVEDIAKVEEVLNERK